MNTATVILLIMNIFLVLTLIYVLKRKYKCEGELQIDSSGEDTDIYRFVLDEYADNLATKTSVRFKVVRDVHFTR